MRIGTAIKRVLSIYEKIKNDPNVQKPVSYALYHTWRWADANEKSRKEQC